jgi:hypothetical protein
MELKRLLTFLESLGILNLNYNIENMSDMNNMSDMSDMNPTSLNIAVQHIN